MENTLLFDAETEFDFFCEEISRWTNMTFNSGISQGRNPLAKVQVISMACAVVFFNDTRTLVIENWDGSQAGWKYFGYESNSAAVKKAIVDDINIYTMEDTMDGTGEITEAEAVIFLQKTAYEGFVPQPPAPPAQFKHSGNPFAPRPKEPYKRLRSPFMP